MPQNEAIRRARESLRARVFAAGLFSGAQIFLLGAGAALPLCGGGAWLAALSAVPVCAAAGLLARRRLSLPPRPLSRCRALLIAAALWLCCVCALGALVSLAEHTLLSQSRSSFVLLSTLALCALAAAGGPVGAVRLSYALRLLPALLTAILLLHHASHGRAAGLFPLLGSGPADMARAAVPMAAGAAPCAMLLLPAEGAQDADDGALPSARFFAVRSALGALLGASLLLALTMSLTHESIAAQLSWGERLHILTPGQRREGIVQAVITMGETLLFALSASGLLSCAAQALSLACPRAGHGASLLLMTLLSGAALAVMVYTGFEAAMGFGFAAALPAACALLLPLSGKTKQEAS